MHYRRWRVTGDPLTCLTAATGEPQAFYDANVGLDTDDCILWPFASTTGYGRLDKRLVHGLACEQFHGPQPKGMETCHSCTNRHCFNPRHLRWDTRVNNSADRWHDGTVPKGEGHYNAALTEAQVRDIRHRSADGDSHVKIAVDFPVGPMTVGKIARRDRWAWLD